MRAVISIGLLVPLATCQPEGRGLLAVVEVPQSSGIKCIDVTVQSPETNTIFVQELPVGTREMIYIGIAENNDFRKEVDISIRGFLTRCNDGSPINLDKRRAALGPKPVPEIRFRFERCIDATCVSTSPCATARCDQGICTRQTSAPGTRCDSTGTCDGQGNCVGRTELCPPQSACNAGLSCARQGTCSDAGLCKPTFAECQTPPSSCLRSLNQCTADGGCAFDVDPSKIGSPCDGGVCYANGICAPTLRASNFDPARLPFLSTSLDFTDAGCIYGFDTGSGGQQPAPLPVGTAGVTCQWPSTIPQPTVLTQNSGPDLVVFSGFNVSLLNDATLHFVGSRSVALLGHNLVRIEGLISVRAESSLLPGPGADYGCPQPRAPNKTENGWAGGSHFEMGGRGAGGTSGTMSVGTTTLTPLRGGCSAGGMGGGLGGGAIQVVGGGGILIGDGGITAPGRAGRGGPPETGAFGGGAGGSILLETRAFLLVNGFLTTNGGSGGQGGCSDDPGDAGMDGRISSNDLADGATGPHCGGKGGNGGAATSPPGEGLEGNKSGPKKPGGGGGGGSRGRIRINIESGGRCAQAFSVISPRINNDLYGPTTTCQVFP